MLFFVLTTGLCNLKCDYCGGSFPERLVPPKPTYEIEELIDFMGIEEPIVAFYGGEPLMNPKPIYELMDRLDAKYVIQTNGLLVDRLDRRIWERFDAILLSIDGVREVTDKHRGRGVYDAVLKAARKLRSFFEGDLIARMTATRDTDIYRDVKHLLGLKLFDHVHWQLDVVWSEPWDFLKWAEESYIPGLRRLMDEWASSLEEGEVIGIAPFQGMLKRMEEGGPAPPCGAGVDSLAVNTDGSILACPIAVDVEWAKLGRIEDGLEGLKASPGIGEPCTSCPYFRVCGGRCLYSYMERLWGDEGFQVVCKVTKKTIDMLREKTDGLTLKEKRAAFYPSYNNTVEIVP